MQPRSEDCEPNSAPEASNSLPDKNPRLLKDYTALRILKLSEELQALHAEIAEPEAEYPDNHSPASPKRPFPDFSVTPKKSAPALRQQTEGLEHFRQLMEHTNQGFLQLSTSGLRFLETTAPTREILGIQNEKQRVRSLYELIDRESADTIDRWLNNSADKRVPHLTLIATIGEKTAKQRQIEISLSIAGATDVSSLIGFVRDVSIIFHENKTLKESTRLLHAVFEHTFQFIGLTDPAGRMLLINRTALDAAGCQEEDVIGKLFWDTRWWQDLEAERLQLINAFERCRQGEFVRYQTFNQTSDGQRIWVDFSLKPVLDNNGSTLYIIPEGRNITEQKLMEERLLHSQKMESIGQLAGGIAHDFNNLLGGIIGAAELLPLQGDLSPEQSKLTNMIMSAAEQAAELTQNLLTFARRQKTGEKPVDLHMLIQDALQILRHSIDKRIRTEVQLDAKRCLVPGDTDQLQTALLNLGSNARDAMPEGGLLRFSTTNCIFDRIYCARCAFNLMPGEYIRLSVTDTGCGIKPELLERIFEPFFTTKSVGKGTGMGLAAVYGMVKAHHGAIELDSTPGKGTSIHLFLPVS